LKAEPVKVKTVKMDQASYSAGGIYLPNGELLIVDRPRKAILRFNESLEITQIYEPIDDNYLPACICHGDNENEFYISFYERKVVKKIKLKDNVQQLNTIVTRENVWSIEKIGQNILVSENSFLHFINTSGVYINSFKKSKASPVKYATVSNLNGNIYSSEGEEVICRTKEGREVFRYSHSLLKDPKGIALDPEDNVYVCGKGSKNIHHISADGSRSRILISDMGQDTRMPMAIAFHPDGTRFCLISFSEGDPIVLYMF